MSAQFDLNALVECGKDDILDVVNAFIPEYFSDAPVLARMFSMSLGKSRAGLDIHRTRELLIAENEEVLAEAKQNDETVLIAMARAAGRIAQLQDCCHAAERVLLTYADEDVKAQRVHRLLAILTEMERQSVRLYKTAQGFELQDLSFSQASPKYLQK